MEWLDERWPEDNYPLYDVVETTTNVLANTTTRVVQANVRRTGLIIGFSATAPGVSASTSSAAVNFQGLPFTTSNNVQPFVGPGWEVVAAQTWFIRNGTGTTAVVTTIEFILNRPYSRPYGRHEFLTRPALTTPGDMLRQYLKQAADRQKSIFDLARGNFNGQGKNPGLWPLQES
jgi:hypothetical protein